MLLKNITSKESYDFESGQANQSMTRTQLEDASG